MGVAAVLAVIAVQFAHLAVSPVQADMGYPTLSTDIGPKRFKSAYPASFPSCEVCCCRLGASYELCCLDVRVAQAEMLFGTGRAAELAERCCRLPGSQEGHQ